MWYVYILKCSDDTLYTGITTEIARRVEEHNSSPLGARYTRSRRPVQLVYSSEFETRAEAAAQEYRIKKMSREQKTRMVEGQHSG